MARLATRVEPINRDIEALIAADLSPEAQSRALAEFAREQLGAAQQANRQAVGRVPPHETFVDRKAGAPIETVRPEGVIVFEFELLQETLLWIRSELIRNSPYRSGRYRDSHVLFAGFDEVPLPGPIPEASEYVFLNVQPYARKIERGLSKQASRGVYGGVAALASRRFGNVAKIRLTFRSPLLGYVKIGRTKKERAAVTAARRSAANMERASRVPAISITQG